MWSVGFAYTAMGIVLTVLPVHLTHALGAGDTTVGLIMGAQAMVAVLLRPLGAAWAERRGYRLILVLGAVCLAIAHVPYLLPRWVAWLGAARMVTGLGEAFVFTSGGAWVLALTSAERRGRAIALFGLALWGGYTVGPLVGEMLAHHGGLAAVAIGGMVLSAMSAASALSLRPVRVAVRADESVPLIPRAVLRPGVTFALAALGYAALSTFAALHFAARGWGGGARPLVAFGIAFLLVRWLGAGLPDRLGSIPVAIGGAMVEASGLLLFASANAPWLALGGALAIGAGFALAYPALALVAVNAVPASHRGATLGAFTSFWDLALAIGAPLSGALTAWGGGAAPFIGGAVCAIAAALLAALLAARPVARGLGAPMYDEGD
ncbi:MAG TPA: MFS transporter [Gemmatimonadaceae bacterium]|nr:MFS transporter [Gemmatimonadaceae bacterium]